MSRSTLILLALLCIPAVAAQPLTFEQPMAAVADSVDARGEWIVLWFGKTSNAEGHMNAHGPTSWTSLHRPLYRVTVPPVSVGGLNFPDPEVVDQSTYGQFLGSIVKKETVAAIAINADVITVSSGPAIWQGTRFDAGSCLGFYQVVDRERHIITSEPMCPGLAGFRGQAVVGREDPESIGFSLRASGILALEAFGFSMACDARCPDLGEVRDEVTPFGPGRLEYRNYTYSRLEGGLDQLQLWGHAAGLELFGELGHLQVNGTTRLPKAGGNLCFEPYCTLEPDQTLRVSGNVTFSELRAIGPDNRMGTSINGNVLSIQIDGQKYPLPSAAGTALAVGAVAALLGVLGKVAAGIFATRTRGDPLGHPNRRLLHEYILAHPGATFRELIRGTQIPAGTARHHLAVLRQEDQIQEHAHKATLRYFENHGRFNDSWNTVVLLREPDLKRLHTWLLKHPDCMQGVVVDAGQSWGWTRSTTQHRLGRMVAEGLIKVTVHGRRKHYTALQRAPVPG